MNSNHIVFIQLIDFPQPGAVDVYYYAKFLAKNPGIHVSVIIGNNKSKLLNTDNLSIFATGIDYGNNPKELLRFFFKSIKILRQIEQKSTIGGVYFFAQHPISVLLAIVSRFILGHKVIYDVRSGPIGTGFLSKIAYWTMKIGVHISNAYVLIDESLHGTLSIKKTKKPYAVIPMGYDSEIFFPNTINSLKRIDTNGKIFLYVGTLNKERNLLVFLDSFLASLKDFPESVLYFIGGGSGVCELQKRAIDYSDNVFFLGYKPHDTIPDYINSADVLVSYVPMIDCFDNQPPTKLIEYLACGKLIMATNTSSQKNILSNQVGILHDDTFEDTYHAIIKSITKKIPTESAMVGSVGMFSWDLLTKKIIELMGRF